MALVELLAIFAAVVVGIITYCRWLLKFWERKNVPTLEPTFPFGNIENPLTRKNNVGVHIKNLFLQLKSRGHKYAGLYLLTQPQYVPIDPDLVKCILQKDFNYFSERGFYYNEKDDPLSAHLFAIGGQKWRNLRTKLTPTFTSGKMKMMFNTLVQCGDQMIEAMGKFSQSRQGVDIREVVACYTTDVIGSCAFGLDCNSFKSPDAEFRKNGKKLFGSSRSQDARIIFGIFLPKLANFLGVKVFDKDVADFFMNVVKETVSYRENNTVDRKDMMKLLIDLKNNTGENKPQIGNGEQNGDVKGQGITMNELAAQALVFFVAGFETSSTTMTFCLYELAKNPQIQQKVRDEVNHVLAKHDGKISYDAIMEMKYLGQVVDETLRKYPPLPFITRECVMDYKVPNTDLVLPKGISVLISVMGLHYDPEHYPNPEKFDPDRFSDSNKQKRHPFTHIPFGEGPRICIALRFGLMQTKVGLAHLLKNYKFSVHESTVEPIVFDRFSFIPMSETAISLNAEKI